MKKIQLVVTALLAVVALFVCCSKEDDTVAKAGIYGVITDAATYQPIQGASVVISPTNATTVTGADGIYSFLNIDASNKQYKVTVTASGYTYNSRQVVVAAGQNTTCDMNLTAEIATTGFSISPESLAFGSSYTELTFTIYNTGNSSSTAWSITGIDVDWLSVSPSAGVTTLGESSVVKVNVNRNYVTESSIAYIIVNAGGGSKQLMISVSPTSSSSSSGSGSSSSTSDEVAVTNNLWAYYTFDDENMNDSWENGMHGLIENNATFLTNTPNGSGKALKIGLNSDNQLVKARVPYNPFANKTEYSYCFWIKEPSQGLIMNAYGNSTDSNTANYPVVRIYDSKLYAGFNSYSMSDCFNYNTSTTLQDGSWHHVAVSVANNSQILYVDGVRVSTQQESVGSSGSSEIHFGGELYNYEGSDMKIDNIRIYSRTISASDALSIYNSEK